MGQRVRPVAVGPLSGPSHLLHWGCPGEIATKKQDATLRQQE